MHNCSWIMLPHPLHKTKDGTYIVNLDEYEPIGTHWIALYFNDNNGSACYGANYLDSFWVEHISKEVKKIIGNKNTMIYRIQAYDSIMCGYVCVGFIDFMLNGNSLLDYTNLFSPNKYEKNDKTIIKHIQY